LTELTAKDGASKG